AYEEALRRRNIVFREEFVVNTDLTQEGNEAAILRLLTLRDRPSAVVSFNDYVTLDVMKTARQKGLVLNRDIHFISYANYPLWKYMENPPMASIEQFPGEQGRKAAEVLFRLIESQTPNNRIEPVRLIFESRLIQR